jgi:hypothetical protein
VPPRGKLVDLVGLLITHGKDFHCERLCPNKRLCARPQRETETAGRSLTGRPRIRWNLCYP